MKRLLGIIFAACTILLAGCASTISSDVTAFHAWPADLKDKSFVFTPTRDQEGSLEYRNYEQLIRAELLRLGFADAVSAKTARLKVAFSYGMQAGTVVVTEPAYDPFWYGPGWHRSWGPWGPGPFYDPFWSPPMQTTTFPVLQRRLYLTITRADNDQKLYEVTVDSEGREATLPMAMPYMVRSAFSDFPGPSGVSRHVELKLDKPKASATVAPAAPANPS
ncbi:DUF4136 domain-containing protein [Herbaspirillum sp. RV1423]|uniref:DUF4136 domain-containing protein n=1 Tax=Herbaspirillum sp. RV1423 TaxID=1443993 RepID=UPI0004AF096F|nr:DUF4136 domain-containing protein [Herbaspirillum sp. RV1423]